MRRKVLLTVAAVALALAYLWLMRGKRVFLFNIPQPKNVSFAAWMFIRIIEEWLMAGLYSLAFAILIATFYRRTWLPLAVTIGALNLALLAVQSGGLSCGHLRWMADCIQMHAREALVLPLVTWPVACIAARVRAL